MQHAMPHACALKFHIFPHRLLMGVANILLGEAPELTSCFKKFSRGEEDHHALYSQ